MYGNYRGPLLGGHWFHEDHGGHGGYEGDRGHGQPRGVIKVVQEVYGKPRGSLGIMGSWSHGYHRGSWESMEVMGVMGIMGYYGGHGDHGGQGRMRRIL